MNLYDLNATDLIYFFGGLARISCILFVVPIFSHPAIPNLVKILTAFAISVVIFPLAYSQLAPSGRIDPDSLTQISLFAVKECLVGFTLGFIAKLIFDSMAIAFNFISLQMGFMFSSFYDPMLEAQSPTLAQFFGVLTTLFFIGFDGHHLIVKAIAESFAVVPLGRGEINRETAAYMLDTGARMFVIGVQLAAPVATILFVMNIAFGIVSRAVPQINVILVSFTVNILVGIVALALFMPMLGISIGGVSQEMFARFYGILRHLHG